MGRGGGGGGRIRFRASKAGHASDQSDELGRQWSNGTSKFGAINSGCFYKSGGLYCPSRLTDYYCVMWSQSQLDDGTGGVAAPLPASLNGNVSIGIALSPPPVRAPEDADICSGDFVTEAIVQANTILPVLLLVTGTLLNLITGRVALSYCTRQLPVCYYLTVLCAVDAALLYFRFVDLWLQSAFDVKLTLTLLLMDETSCQLLTMLYSSLHHFKAMLQIAMAVDARRLVLRPLHCVERYSAEWVKNGLILMCVILVLLNGHHLWTLTVVKENAVGDADRVFYCGWGTNWPVTELFTTWLWPLADLLVGDLLPVGAVLCAACSGYRHLSLTRSSRSEQQPSLACHIIDVRLFHRVSVALLNCSLAYAALTSPSVLHNCVMYGKFIAASLAAQASGARGLGQVYRPAADDWLLFVGRVCTGLQPIANSALLLACVPQFRVDAARLLGDWWRLRRHRQQRRSQQQQQRRLCGQWHRAATGLSLTEDPVSGLAKSRQHQALLSAV